MNKKITINGKDYALKEIDFNNICELEDLGLSISDFKKTKLMGMRALLAFAGGITPEEAGVEIMEHLKKGGTFDDLAPLVEIVSSFFQSIRQPNTEA